MEERYVLMSGTREFDDVIRGTAAECSMGYCEIMGHELRVERDEDGDWFYSLNTTGDEDDWERYDPVPCDGDREEALREGHKWFFLDYLNDGGQRRGKRPDNSPRGGGGGVPAGLRRAVGVHHGAGGPGPLPGPGRGVRDAALVSRESGQEEGGLGAQPWATTHHRKHDQPEGGSIVPPSGTDSKGGNDDGTERTCGEGQGPEGAQADGRGAGGGDSGYRGRYQGGDDGARRVRDAGGRVQGPLDQGPEQAVRHDGVQGEVLGALRAAREGGRDEAVQRGVGRSGGLLGPIPGKGAGVKGAKPPFLGPMRNGKIRVPLRPS